MWLENLKPFYYTQSESSTYNLKTMSFPYSGGDATAPAQAQAIPVIPNPAGGLPTGDAVPVVATPVVATPVPGPVYATPVNADPVVPQVNPYVPPPGVSFNSGYVNAQPVNAVPAYGPGAANLSLPQTVQVRMCKALYLDFTNDMIGCSTSYTADASWRSCSATGTSG